MSTRALYGLILLAVTAVSIGAGIVLVDWLIGKVKGNATSAPHTPSP